MSNETTTDVKYSEDSHKREFGRSIDGPSETKEVFVSNMPYNVSEAGITTALKRIFSKAKGFVGVKKITIQRGLAMIEFESHAEAEAAVQMTQDVKIGPRTLSVKLNDPFGAKARRIERESGITDQRSLALGHDTHPNPDCWFCLANPGADTQLIFAVDPAAEIYMSLSKGCITPLHSFICPVTHFGCFAQASDKVRDLCCEYSERFCDKLATENMGTIIFERWIPMNATAANHMQVHLVPIEKERNQAIDWRNIIRDQGKKIGIDFIPINGQADVTRKMEGILNRVSYLFISFPAGDHREFLLGIGKMSFTFPREILCTGLGCPERMEWRSCESDPETEASTVDRLKSLFNPS